MLYNYALARDSVKEKRVMPKDGTAGHSGVRTLASAVLLALLVGGCQPTVKVETPTEPITINATGAGFQRCSMNIASEVSPPVNHQGTKACAA